MPYPRTKEKGFIYILEVSLLLLGLFMLQFYFFESGKPQVSHILLFLFSISSILFHQNRTFLEHGDKVFILLSLFTLYSCLINLLVCAFTSASTSILVSNAFLLFNWGLFMGLSTHYARYQSLKPLLWGLSIPLLLALLFYFAGLGNYTFAPRYSGMFNDPNQMAFWVLCSLSSIFLLSQNKLLNTTLFIVSVILCIATMSRSALVGLLPLGLGFYLKWFSYIKRTSFKIASIVLVAMTIALITVHLFTEVQISEDSTFGLFYNRLVSTDIEGQLETRGYNILAEYGEYILFGAGQGDMARFGHDVEIHSTWLGILFYYGVVGFSLFVGIFVVLLRRAKLYEILIALGPILYGMSTYGARTPVFYIFIFALYMLYIRTRNEREQTKAYETSPRNI